MLFSLSSGVLRGDCLRTQSRHPPTRPRSRKQHNNKNYNCSFQFEGHSLNEFLLPGPTLDPSLLAVLLLLQGTNFTFTYNPPSAPHFGGCWEREIHSIKAALRVTIGAQTVTEEVLRTVLIEVEGILNSKPLGYSTSDTADLDPITPYCFLIGR
ncbi:hypothetical protein QQF64_013621 [Cirrhinus molitorella]|uniref:Uncharacterized protein n=1 Tax=Cirrhinus molitorella TaxID=172907 RepID=A0ABR3LRP8_9TELE